MFQKPKKPLNSLEIILEDEKSCEQTLMTVKGKISAIETRLWIDDLAIFKMKKQQRLNLEQSLKYYQDLRDSLGNGICADKSQQVTPS